MKIKFIFPDFETHLETHQLLADYAPGYFLGNYRVKSLGIPSVAAVTPTDIEITAADEQVEEINFDEDIHLAALSVFTPQAKRAYEIADIYRSRNIPVVMGGKHPTVMPDECLRHADVIVSGEAEGAWESFLADFRKGPKNCQKIYRPKKPPDLEALPNPRRELLQGKKGYTYTGESMFVSKGCFIQCQTCLVPFFEQKLIRVKPVEAVARELESISHKNIYLTDDSIFCGRVKEKYLQDLFALFHTFDKKVFVTLTPSFIKRNPQYLDIIKPSCSDIYLIYYVSSSLLDENARQRFQKEELESGYIIDMLHQKGFSVLGSFFLGTDNHDESIFDGTIEFTIKNNFEAAEFTMVTPYPGTPFYKKCKNQGRLLHRDWSKYNSSNVVFKPRLLSPEKLAEGFLLCWKEFWRHKQTSQLHGFKIS